MRKKQIIIHSINSLGLEIILSRHRTDDQQATGTNIVIDTPLNTRLHNLLVY